jgi:opacity protein-like surface antigen
MSGFRVGVQGGFNHFNSKTSGKVLNTKVLGSSGKGSVAGGLTLGYDAQFGNNFVAGLETYMLFMNGKTTTKGKGALSSLKSTNKQKNTYGVAVRLGMKFADSWLAGIKLGSERTKFSNKVGILSKSKSETGGVVGAFVEKFVTKNILVGAEYTFTQFAKHTFTGKVNTVTVVKVESKPVNHRAMVKLAYKF